MNPGKLLFIVVCCGTFCNAQNYHELPNVSQTYNVIVNAERYDAKNCTGKTTIDLYDKTTMKKHQTLSSDNFYLELNENKKPIADSLKNSVVFADFNFDGNDDVAIADGLNNDKRLYKVYLKNESGPFALNEGLTEFVQDHSLAFQTDSDRKRIITSSQNGCCRNFKSEYIFTPEQRLVKVYEFEEDTRDPKKVTTVEKEFKDYKWFSKTTTYPRELYFKDKK